MTEGCDEIEIDRRTTAMKRFEHLHKAAAEKNPEKKTYLYYCVRQHCSREIAETLRSFQFIRWAQGRQIWYDAR